MPFKVVNSILKETQKILNVLQCGDDPRDLKNEEEEKFEYEKVNKKVEEKDNEKVELVKDEEKDEEKGEEKDEENAAVRVEPVKASFVDRKSTNWANCIQLAMTPLIYKKSTKTMPHTLASKCGICIEYARTSIVDNEVRIKSMISLAPEVGDDKFGTYWNTLLPRQTGGDADSTSKGDGLNKSLRELPVTQLVQCIELTKEQVGGVTSNSSQKTLYMILDAFHSESFGTTMSVEDVVDNNSIIVVAILEHRTIAGMCVLRKSQTGTRTFLHNLCTDKQYRGRGVASYILQHVNNKHGTIELDVMSTAAPVLLPFYIGRHSFSRDPLSDKVDRIRLIRHPYAN